MRSHDLSADIAARLDSDVCPLCKRVLNHVHISEDDADRGATACLLPAGEDCVAHGWVLVERAWARNAAAEASDRLAALAAWERKEAEGRPCDAPERVTWLRSVLAVARGDRSTADERVSRTREAGAAAALQSRLAALDPAADGWTALVADLATGSVRPSRPDIRTLRLTDRSDGLQRLTWLHAVGEADNVDGDEWGDVASALIHMAWPTAGHTS
jgi:hypothetical protein